MNVPRCLEALGAHCANLEQLDVLGSNHISRGALETLVSSCRGLQLLDVAFCHGIERDDITALHDASAGNVTIKHGSNT